MEKTRQDKNFIYTKQKKHISKRQIYMYTTYVRYKRPLAKKLI